MLRFNDFLKTTQLFKFRKYFLVLVSEPNSCKHTVEVFLFQFSEKP